MFLEWVQAIDNCFVILMLQITFSIEGFKADFGDSNDMANKLDLQYIQAFHKPISSMISNCTVNDFVDEFFTK